MGLSAHSILLDPLDPSIFLFQSHCLRGIQNAVSSLTLLLVMQASGVVVYSEFEVGSFYVYDSDSLVTL